MNENIFICPICKKALTKTSKAYLCKNGHCFDIAADGHVNLLTVNNMHSHDPGDDKMMVRARNAFLAKGYYACLKDALEKICVKYAACNVKLLDLGCGEGYYTNGVLTALEENGKLPIVAGIDISKAAACLAAKKNKDATIAVASVFHLPVADTSVDMMLNCFSPLCTDEIVRGLKQGGYFIYVVPAARHLWGLKTVLYEHPYENECKETQYEGMKYVTIEHVRDNIHLACNEDIQNLFSMTPYFWKTSKEDKDKLCKMDSLDTEIAFDVHLYQKL
ncbi:MAG: methyltransferase domain-containing protein [Oscillospiraceae bacterium]